MARFLLESNRKVKTLFPGQIPKEGGTGAQANTMVQAEELIFGLSFDIPEGFLTISVKQLECYAVHPDAHA